MHTVTIVPAKPGRYDAFYLGGQLLVGGSRMPFLDGARRLLAEGFAGPAGDAIMASTRQGPHRGRDGGR
jgi:hypothetical protein